MAKAPPAGRKTRPMTSAELGRWGEARFEAMCLEARLVPNRPSYDLNGWDFFVQFPHPVADMDTDIAGRQEPLACFVQVKTIWERRPEVDLRLSAAARLGKASLPSFLCILEASEAQEIRCLHLIYMAGPLLERLLRQLRKMQAGRQSTLINKTGFRVKVPSVSDGLQPTGATLRWAIENAVGPDYANSVRDKGAFLRTAGFSATPVTVTIRIRPENYSEYSDFMLGLKELPVVDFAAVESRWGINLPAQLEGRPVTVRTIPQFQDVQVVWRRVGALKSVRMTMQAILMPGSGVDSQMDRWRFTHPNVEMRIDGNSFFLKMRGPDTVRTGYRTLVQLHAIEDLLASDDPVDVQLFFQSKLIMAWRLNAALVLRSRDAIMALGEILRELGIILSSAGLHDIQLPTGSWSEWTEHVWYLLATLETPDNITASVTLNAPDSKALTTENLEALHVTALEFHDYFLAYYSTCQGRLTLEGLPGHWKLRISNFVIRELRQVEKSEEAMRAFAKEAEAVTGLNTVLLAWGPLLNNPKPSQAE